MIQQSAAFQARLSYERNCIAKYDRPGRPSKIPIEGERMADFATRFGCTVEDMKEVLNDVEKYMGE